MQVCIVQLRRSLLASGINHLQPYLQLQGCLPIDFTLLPVRLISISKVEIIDHNHVDGEIFSFVWYPLLHSSIWSTSKQLSTSSWKWQWCAVRNGVSISILSSYVTYKNPEDKKLLQHRRSPYSQWEYKTNNVVTYVSVSTTFTISIPSHPNDSFALERNSATQR